jgi:hypothetical protein
MCMPRQEMKSGRGGVLGGEGGIRLEQRIINDPTPQAGGTPTRHHRGRDLPPKPPATTQYPLRGVSLWNFDFPVTVCDMTEVDIGEDADSWYNDVKLQLPASAPLTDVSHYHYP